MRVIHGTVILLAEIFVDLCYYEINLLHCIFNRINRTYNSNFLIWKRRPKVICSSYYVFQLLSVPAIKSSIIVKSKKKWWKQTRITVRHWEISGDKYKIKDTARKRSEREKGSIYTQISSMNSRKRGSTNKRISIEEVGRTISLWHPKRNRRITTIHFIIIIFETNYESKYKKHRKKLPFSPRKKVEITGIKDSCGKNKSRKNEERIESGGKRVTQEFFKNSKYNLHIPGRRDTVYVGKDHGKRQYKQERYLLWKIRGSLDIINAS